MEKIPQHVSIIMDGNGRWARERGRERVFGHLNGVGSVRAVTEECARSGVKYLSLYAFSEENWGRPKEEVHYQMNLMGKTMADEMDNLLRNGIRLRVLGNRGRLDPQLDQAVTKLEEMSAGNDRMTLIIFLSYSGKWDILQAFKRMAREMTPEQIQAMEINDVDPWLVTDGIPDPDLIIRTSGEQRISNYLLWQGAYSEFYFTDTMWPDFREEALHAAFEEYARRDRRYGKVK